MVPDLLILPPGVDLHDHPLVTSGSVFLQVCILVFIAFSMLIKPFTNLTVTELLFDFTILGQGKFHGSSCPWASARLAGQLMI